MDSNNNNASLPASQSPLDYQADTYRVIFE